jgi:hypothetical protein
MAVLPSRRNPPEFEGKQEMRSSLSAFFGVAIVAASAAILFSQAPPPASRPAVTQAEYERWKEEGALELEPLGHR